MSIKKLTGFSVFMLFAAAALCAEDGQAETAATENLESEESESDEIVEAGTGTAIRWLIHYIERMAKLEKFLIEAVIGATDGVGAKVTIYGFHNEEQTGDGIIFTAGGEYSGDSIVAGYYIKDLYPEASNSGYISVKKVEVSSSYSNKDAVCGIFHEQGGIGAQQDFGSVTVTERFKVSYSGENASVAGIWQKGSDTNEPPYIRGSVKLNGLEISATGSESTAYGIFQDGNAHIDGNVELRGTVSSTNGNAFGVKGGLYKANIFANLTVTAGGGSASGIYLDRTAGSLDGAPSADDTTVAVAELKVTASADAVGILLGGESTFDEDGNVIGESKGGNVTGALSNYNITATSLSANPDNMAVGLYMHNGASVGSVSNLTISAISYCGPSAGFVYDNSGTETMSVGSGVTGIKITAESFLGNNDSCGRVSGIVIGKAADFTVDSSAITVKPAGGRNSYGLAYGKDVSGETDESDGGVGIFNHTEKDSSGLNITNSQFTAYAYGTMEKTPSAYGLYLVGSSTYAMAGNSFTAIASGGNAYGLYAAGTSTVSNLTTVSAKESQHAYGVYLDGSASVDAATLTEIVSESNTVDGSAFGIYKASAESSFNNFSGKISLKTVNPKNAVYGLYYSDAALADGASVAVYNAETNDSSVSLSENVSVEINNESPDNTTYGIYVSGSQTVSTPSIKISVSGSGNGDIYGAYVASGDVTLAGTISATREGGGTGKLVGLWTGTAATASLNGATITATAGDALASEGTMSLASVGQSAAQISGNVSVAEKLHFTQGAFSLNAGTISADAWEIGSADASGNVTTANVALTANTKFSGNEMTFYVKAPQTRAVQDAVISVADGATLTALATAITVVLEHNSTYETGDVITLVGGNASFDKIDSVVVLQNGVTLNSAFYTYGNVAGGWGITFIPEPSAFGLLAGALALALCASRRRRKEAATRVPDFFRRGQPLSGEPLGTDSSR